MADVVNKVIHEQRNLKKDIHRMLIKSCTYDLKAEKKWVKKLEENNNNI